MLQRLKSVGAILVLAALALYVLARTRISGDGGEYLMMTHALFKHGSLQIRASDVDDFMRLSLPEMIRIAFPRELFQMLQAQMQAPAPVSAGGFFPTASGHFYAMHFWMYSLLALPFYVLLKLFGLNAVWAFGLLNMSFAGAALAYLRRSCAQHAPLAFALFLAMGTTFYLAWTGPEVMSAACALIAVIALLRGDAGLAILMAGLGASQNPPLVFMMPFAVAFRVLLHFQPQLAWPGSVARGLQRRDVLMALAGVTMALLPYAWFQLLFGMPSLIARYSTAPQLISMNRFVSLYFDLDQGMLVGVPGLLLALALTAVLALVARSGRWLAAAGAVLAAVLAMTVPALSAVNWNSGCVVMLRYAYWLAMPLLALLLLALRVLPAPRVRALCWTALALQLALFAGTGVLGERSDCIRHNALARWMLKHHPAAYNPDIEVFFERSVGREEAYDRNTTYLYRVGERPLKLLRHWTNQHDTAGLCAPGQLLEGSDVRTIDGGWQYLHAPYRCMDAGSVAPTVFWHIDAGKPDSMAPLGAGWSHAEGMGVWTNATSATLALPVPQGRQALRVHMVGNYYANQRNSIVSIDGQELGKVSLTDGAFEVPAALRHARVLHIGLRHPDAVSPKSRGESQDDRTLGLYLQLIALETEKE